MPTLSNVDIEKEIGFNIYIYPFSKRNLRGASYNLTVSKLAWDIETKRSIYDPHSKKIIIPKQTTVLIETNESIWVSRKISGTYHSKVALVSKGLSHIGTTLDPDYVGSSLIAIHNHNNHDVSLTPELDTFATLVFHYLNSEASVKPGNDPGRPDVLRGFDLSQEEDSWLDEDFRKITDRLRIKMEESNDFREILANRTSRRNRMGSGVVYIALIVLFVLSILVYTRLDSQKALLEKEGWYNIAINAVFFPAFGIPTAFLGKWLSDISSKN
jgi:deoxycytidine triphosphate deaminase